MATLTPFRYAGAKNRLLPILQTYLDPLLLNSQDYVEPFVGGGSVALYVAKQYPNINIHLNDKDPWVSAFWKVVSSSNQELIQELIFRLETKPTIQLFNHLGNNPPQSLLDKAYYCLFFNRTTFSGIFKRDKQDCITSSPIGGQDQKSKWTVDCRYNFKKLKEKLLFINQLLQERTKVSNLDIDQYLSTIPTEYAMYLDPPYYLQAHMLYNQNMKREEHIQFAFTLQKHSNWILSYDDHPEIRKLYADNQIIDLAAKYSINGKKNKWAEKNELLIIGNK